MKKKLTVCAICTMLALTLAGCGNARPAETGIPAADPDIITDIQVSDTGRQDSERYEAASMLEGMEETERYDHSMNNQTVVDRDSGMTLSDEQALAAVRSYCLIRNPDLENIVNAGVYPVYWAVSSSDEHEIVVLFRSYTGAQIRYHIDRVTGETYVTESVPEISPEEVRTEESLNVWEYLQ